MVADSERDANMLYATGLFVPDPFIYLSAGGRPLLVMSDLEIDRARAQAPHCRVASFSAYQQKLRARRRQIAGLRPRHPADFAREKNPPRRRAGQFSARPGQGLEKTRRQAQAARRTFFPETRNQIRRRGPENFRRADDGRGRHGRGHGGPAPLQNRPQPQAHLPRPPAHVGKTALGD